MSNIYDVHGNAIIRNTTPEMYGAYGDGVKDDTIAIQNAVNNKGLIVFGTGKYYKVASVIRIPKDTILELNGSTLIMSPDNPLLRIFVNFLPTDTEFTEYNGNGNITIRNGTIVGGNISFAHGENILLSNVHFKDGLSPHFLEICACKNYYIKDCSFTGVCNSTLSVHEYINFDMAYRNAFPLLPAGSTFFDGTANDGVYVDGCDFSLGVGDFAYGYNALGVHGTMNEGIHKNIVIRNNRITGFTGCGLRINDMQNVMISGNDIQVSGDGIRVGDVALCNDVTIINNFIVPGVSSQMIALTAERYTGLTIANNVAKETNDLDNS